MARRDISIRLGVDGLSRTQAALSRISAAGQRMGASVGRVGSAASNDIRRIGRAATGTARLLGGVTKAASLITFGGAIAGALALNGVLRKSSDIAKKSADEIDRIGKLADSVGLENRIEFGGLEFAFSQGGASPQEAEKIVLRLIELADKATLGDQAAQESLARLGIRNTGELLDNNDNLLDAVDLVKVIADSFSEIENRAEAASAIVAALGAKNGAKASVTLSGGGDLIQSQLEEFIALTGITPEDFELAARYNDTKDREDRVRTGAAAAFSRDLTESLIAASEARADFLQRSFEDIQNLGKIIGEFIDDLTPLLIEFGDQLFNVLAGKTEDLQDTPLTQGIQVLLGLIETLSTGLIELLEYITTGETDAEWINSLIKGFEDLEKFYEDFKKAFKEDILPILKFAKDAFVAFAEALGFETAGGQFAFFLVLLAFQGVIFSLARLAIIAAAKFGIMLGTLIPAGAIFGGVIGHLKKIVGLGVAAAKAIGGVALAIKTSVGVGAAAAGAAVLAKGKVAAGAIGAGAAALGAGTIAAGVGAGAAVIGTGIAIKSTDDLEKAFRQVSAEAKALADTEGEAFAAAYLRAFIDSVPDEFKTANLASRITSLLPGIEGVDLEGARQSLDVIIEDGNADDAVRGAAAAFQRFGWDVDPEGQIEIGAGITVRGVELTGQAENALENFDISSAIGIPGLEGLAERYGDVDAGPAFNALDDAGGSVQSRLAEMSESMAGIDRTMSQELGELNSQKTPIYIQLPGGQFVETQGNDETVNALLREYRRAGRTTP